jgi:two-component system, cell cycle sensor histidine kinase PleC
VADIIPTSRPSAAADPALAAVRGLVGAASVPMAVFDAAGECLVANAAFVLHAARYPEPAAAAAAERRVGFSPDGERRWTLATLAEEQGPPREAKEQAEAGSRATSRFLGTMSHELRTPLNAVIGFAEIMQEELFGPLGSPEYREYAGLIRQSGHALLDLITNLLDVARAEAGTLPLTIADVELLRLLRSVVAGAQEQAAAGATAPLPAVEIEPPAGTIGLRADEQRLRQLLRALIGNALKFTPPGGRVTIRASALAEGGAEVVVADSGAGMSQAELEQAFEPFWQADARHGRAREGAGIGLKLARQLAALHGGTLLLESEPGQGTRAVLRLPAAPPEAAPPPSGAAAALC